MPNFPIFDLNAPVIGRADVIRMLRNNYTSISPAHLSLVGPRFSGKSVLLKTIAAEMEKDESSQFKIVVFWDLGHKTPTSDEDFLHNICKEISLKLHAVDRECSEILQRREDPFHDLREVIEHLADENIKIVMLWDGFDKPLSSGKLTRNLWDQLRELAQSSSLRLITASRKPLHKLIRDEESVTSDFWNIFDPNSIKIGAFNEDDKSAVLEKLNNIEFDKGAITELTSWTGGFPLLYLLVINQLLAMSLNQVNNINVSEAANAILANSASGILEDLWNDWSEETKEVFLHLIDKNEIPISSVPKQERIDLTEAGFGKQSGNKILKNCRLMENHIKDQREDIDSVARLYKENDNYQKNIKSVLIHRFNQVKNNNPHLNILIKKVNDCIQDVQQNRDPGDCLANTRNVLKTALDLILEREFPDTQIPEDWIDTWKRVRPNLNILKSWPSNEHQQLTLLGCMVGAHLGQDTQPKAKFVNKAAYYCLRTIQNYGNYGNHHHGETVSIEVMFVAVMTCIELVASLDK
jgi:hypothetical protein